MGLSRPCEVTMRKGFRELLHEEIVLVTGLPRAGTSLMMQLLARGGLPPLTDEERAPDPNNPRGYYEFEPVRRLAEGADWLAQAEGRALKVVAPLLPLLPPGYPYRVIFMERPLAEILRSQQRMRQRLGEGGDSPIDPALLQQALAQALARARRWVAQHAAGCCLFVSYPQLVHHPAPEIERLVGFFDGRLDPAGMATAIDPALYRERIGNIKSGASDV